MKTYKERIDEIIKSGNDNDLFRFIAHIVSDSELRPETIKGILRYINDNI